MKFYIIFILIAYSSIKYSLAIEVCKETELLKNKEAESIGINEIEHLSATQIKETFIVKKRFTGYLKCKKAVAVRNDVIKKCSERADYECFQMKKNASSAMLDDCPTGDFFNTSSPTFTNSKFTITPNISDNLLIDLGEQYQKTFDTTTKVEVLRSGEKKIELYYDNERLLGYLIQNIDPTNKKNFLNKYFVDTTLCPAIKGSLLNLPKNSKASLIDCEKKLSEINSVNFCKQLYERQGKDTTNITLSSIPKSVIKKNSTSVKNKIKEAVAK